MPINILDYGCGKLRLLNALLKRFNEHDWHYTGYDHNPVNINELSNEFTKLKRFEIKSRKELLNATSEYDILLAQNVIHEMTIYELATLLQDCHVLLKEDGQLIIIDTPLLPKGEPDFIPIFEWELNILFKHIKTHSRKSPKGLPILFLSIHKNGIPYYANVLKDYGILLMLKRSTFAILASDLCKKKNNKIIELTYLGLDRYFDYVYLNIVIGNITRRLEERKMSIPEENVIDQSSINELAIKIIDMLENSHCTICEVYSTRGVDYPYELVFYVMQLFIENYMFIFMDDTFNGSKELITSELYDVLLDHVGGRELIRRMGLEKALIQARIYFGNNDPGNPFGL